MSDPDAAPPAPQRALGRGPALARRLQVVVPAWLAELPEHELAVPVRGWGAPARAVRTAIPVLLVVLGGVLAVAAAVLAERPATEGIGTLGTELGAAASFAGGMLLVLSRAPTVGRVLALVGTALGGLLLIALALVLSWDGAALALAMEYGVAAVALLIIDVVLLGLVYPRVAELAAGPDRGVVTLRLGGGRPSVAARRVPEHADADEPLPPPDQAGT